MSNATAGASAAEIVSQHYRQIHLDFHTSPLLKGVGAEFDAEEFAQTLADAHVNWVTLFGKCHHGMSYYPTKAGVMHPGLSFDLLGRQIEACKRKGMITPVYLSVRVDQHMGTTRQDLVARLEDGRLWGPNVNEASWYQMCLGNTEYIDYLAAQTEEVFKNYDADGIFYDMCYYPPDPGCFCEKCLARLEKSGHSRYDADAHRNQSYEIMRGYTTRLRKLCRDLKPDATVFFNSLASADVGNHLDALSHLEIESLTTGGWGYLYFPAMCRLLRTYPLPTQGMTARFHKSWADFGGLKTTAQLDYEAATMLSAGSVINVGDQLHPRGRLDTGVYKQIGRTFARVEAAEPWCHGAQPVAEVAVLSLPPRAGLSHADPARCNMSAAYEGAAAMMTALKIQWNGETADRDNLSRYRLVIIPDRGVLEAEAKQKLADYVNGGGSLLFSHEATLNEGDFQIADSPVRYIEPCPWVPSYMDLGPALLGDLPDTEYVNYREASYVDDVADAQPYGELWRPYFNRAPEHFSSHQQTPADQPTGHPVGAMSANGRIGYLAPAVFEGYRNDGFFVYKEMVARMLERLLPEPLVAPLAQVPAAMEISVMRQPAENRLVAHLVNFQPQRQTAANMYIESETAVCNVEFALRMEAAPGRVYLAPTGEEIAFVWDGHTCRVTVPAVSTHAMVVFE